MQSFFLPVADWLSTSELRAIFIEMLRTVPGLPPILQSLHILSIAIIMASAVAVHLRVLGLALNRQTLGELQSRVKMWFYCAIPLLLSSGLPFIFARPYRYFKNPVFGIKMLCLLITLPLVWWIYTAIQSNSTRVNSALFKMTNGLALVLWVAIIFAGRWIAYTEYLFNGL